MARKNIKTIPVLPKEEIESLINGFTTKIRDCYFWNGPSNSVGYGLWRSGQGRYLIHRVIYRNTRGEIDDLLEVDHLCRNRLCINPEHLELVTHRENMRRAAPFIVMSRGNKCKRGHLFTPENTLWRQEPSKGKRSRACKKCYLAAQKRAAIRRKKRSI